MAADATPLDFARDERYLEVNNTASDIVPDSERRGLIGALPAAARPYASLIRLDRPIGAWLLFWPGAWAVALAVGTPSTSLGTGGWALIGWLALGAWAMRSAGCVYNDIVDRELDAQVERTRLRPLASGRVSLTGAWLLLLAMCLIGLLVFLQLGSMAMVVGLAEPALCRRLSIHEAHHLVAPGLARAGLFLGGAGRLGRRAGRIVRRERFGRPHRRCCTGVTAALWIACLGKCPGRRCFSISAPSSG